MTKPRTRRLAVSVFVVVLALWLTACGTETATPTVATAPAGQATNTAAAPPAADAGDIIWLSTQLAPVEEGEKLRNTILKDFKGKVQYVTQDPGPFADRLLAELKANKVTISLVGGQHGDFPPFIAVDGLEDLSSLAAKLKDRNIPQSLQDLGKMGSDKQYYIPWMQATYVMAANKQALQYLPSGADVNKLTYDQFKAWAANIQKGTGQRKLGLPAGPNGLIHRLFQGYLYPAFTGKNVTAFRSADAVQMWSYVKDLWQYANPQSTTYEFMQEPLLSGEVWLTIDHTARLIKAVTQRPDDFVLAPAPSGPKGLAYMPVVTGMAIPKGAPNRAGAEQLIDFMTKPETQIATLRNVAFFPVVKVDLPADLPRGTQMEAAAVAAQIGAANALPSLLPVGLGAKGGEFNKAFIDTFQRIVIKGEDIQTVLDAQAQTMQTILTSANAKCWAPDPPSTGPCQVQ